MGPPPHPSPINRPCVQPNPLPLAAADDRQSRDGSHVHSWTIRRDRHPAMPLHHRHDYAAGFHRGLWTGDITQSRSSPHDRSRAGARCDPAHVRQVLGWWVRLRGFQPLVPHVCLSVSLAEPAPSGSTDTARRCQGLLHHPPPYRGRWPSSSYQTPAATGIQRCPLTTARSKNASWRSKSATQS